MMADFGYDTYSTTIETSWKLVDEKPDLVQRFVNGTIEGWYSYLYGDPGPANAVIKKDNADMTDDQIAYSIGAMKKNGIVESGEAEKLGIGAMSDARWKDFLTVMVEAGVYTPDLPYQARVHPAVREQEVRDAAEDGQVVTVHAASKRVAAVTGPV